MNQDYSRNREGAITLDVPYLLRILGKSALVIVFSACIAAVAVYIGLDQTMKDTYTASTYLSVVPRGTSASLQSDSSTGTALTRCLNVLNSDTLKDQIAKDEEVSNISGTISASRIENTNLILLSVTGNSAEEVFRLLKSALEAYPELSDYFESGYLIRNLTSLSADNVAHSYADPMHNTILAALAVVIVGVGLAVLMALYTDKIHCQEQAGRLLDVPILGSLSLIKKKKGQEAILISDEKTEPVYLEDMDKLSTRVQNRLDAHHFHTLLVTSIRENDGKSTVAANIAMNLAQRGKKVFLVDCDMRKPALARIFDFTVEDGHSLSDFLTGKCELPDTLAHIDGTGKMMAVMQKKAVADADKMLESEQFAQLLQILKKNADYVILDTPPLGIVRDAEIASKSTDAALVSFRQDEIRAGDINDTIDFLEKAGAYVIGGVLNMTREFTVFRKKDKGYGYDYGKQIKR